MSRTTITKEIVQQVSKLAERGFSNIQIAKSLNIGVTTLSMNKELIEAIQRGKLSLAEQVSDTVLETIKEDSAMRQLLVKRLCLFLPTIKIVKPTDAKSALSNLATATKLYANGEINESQLRTIEAVSNSYIKGKDITELEERVTALEEVTR